MLTQIRRGNWKEGVRAARQVWHGRTSERLTVKGPDGEDGMDFAFAEFWHSRVSRDTGVSGGGFAGAILLKTDEANDDGGIKNFRLRQCRWFRRKFIPHR